MPSPLRPVPLTDGQLETISWAVSALLDDMQFNTEYWQDNPMWPEREKAALKRSAHGVRRKIDKLLDKPDHAAIAKRLGGRANDYRQG